MDLQARLSARSRRSPEEFNLTLKRTEEQYERAGYRPEASSEDLLPGTYYLEEVDSKFRRNYVRKVFLT
jgi:hydroxymethylglutaryl-CoA synthase